MPTGQVLPEDAIGGLPGEPRYPDPAAFLLAVLRKEWNPKATDGIAPQVDFNEDMKGINFRSNDQILVYTISARREPATVDYNFKNEYETISLDFFTAHPEGRRHLVRMMREAERVVDAHRTDVYNSANSDAFDNDISGRHWLRWGVRITDFTKNYKGYWRQTVEVEVLWRYRQIAGNC